MALLAGALAGGGLLASGASAYMNNKYSKKALKELRKYQEKLMEEYRKEQERLRREEERRQRLDQQKYADIRGELTQQQADNRRSLAKQTKQGESNIREESRRTGASIGQGLAARGLGNSTLASSAEAGLARDRAGQINSYRDAIGRERRGMETDLTRFKAGLLSGQQFSGGTPYMGPDRDSIDLLGAQNAVNSNLPPWWVGMLSQLGSAGMGAGLNMLGGKKDAGGDSAGGGVKAASTGGAEGDNKFASLFAALGSGGGGGAGGADLFSMGKGIFDWTKKTDNPLVKYNPFDATLWNKNSFWRRGFKKFGKLGGIF